MMDLEAAIVNLPAEYSGKVGNPGRVHSQLINEPGQICGNTYLGNATPPSIAFELTPIPKSPRREVTR